MRDSGVRHIGRLQRGVRPVVVTAALCVAMSACSFSDEPDDGGAGQTPGAGRLDARTAAALAAVEKATERAGSARVSSSSVMGDLLSMRTAGVLGWAGEPVGRLSITYTGGELAESMRALNSSSMEARLLPDAYYAKVGDKFAAQMRGKHWIRYGYDDLADLPGGSGTYLKDQLRNTAPIQPVELLLASGDARRAGTETVRGERTTHYSGTVDVAALADSALRDQLVQAGVTTETVDIWVNDRNLLVKKVEQGELSSGRMSSTAYYSAYGVKATVKAPEGGDTADFKDLLGNSGASSASPG
ncbi:hypothetical protein RB628_25265 [Streptomyces sp. ADMS]|uniref:hypothetical protein n=1 Tax=Streptomyces sp. ADMS TaxID=3071415 RepID=UPI00296E9FC4|nr:hypothetical protein [Streptomyces sp. ADMS]MDW4908556.1 hypothetical protein [Streptomyces sp. ADMS]